MAQTLRKTDWRTQKEVESEHFHNSLFHGGVIRFTVEDKHLDLTAQVWAEVVCLKLLALAQSGLVPTGPVTFH